MNNEVATAPAVAVKSTPATIPAAAKTTATASTNAALESLISPLNACFSISLHPLLLGDYVGTYNSGCVVTVSGPETIVGFSSSSFMKMIVSKLQLEIEAVPGKSFAGAVEQLLQREADSLIDVASAAKKYSKSTQPMVVQDELDWFKNSSMRSYAFLRRLAMPMHIHGLGTESKLKQLEFSFLDLLLKLDALKGIAHKCSLSRIRILEKEKAEPSKSCKEIEMLQELHKLLKDTIDRAGVSETNDIIDVCDKKVLFVSYTIPERKREEVLAVRAERKRLLQDLEERKKNQGAEVPHFTVGGKIKLPYRIYNGCLLVTENELSHDGFCSQMKIMAKVNKTLPRPYYPGVSRPKLEKVGLSKDAMHRLRSIFFDLDGSLKDSVAIDIDLSKKHGYINFANSASRDTRNDYRWQVPIQLHSLRGFIDVRAAIESLFSEKKILHPGKEEIHDIGILIGGTEDQSLHHDIPRQTTSWLEKSPKRFKTTGVPIKGWEFDRAAYNESMASPYAPSSILLGMSDSGVVNLGVQKNQIERYDCQEGICTIKDGKTEETFQIVRENEYLVVLRTGPGAIFTGDFPHAGVRNFPVGSEENKLMTKLYQAIEAIRQEGEENDIEHNEMTTGIIKMLCRFKNLDKLCRFHCSTEPLSGPLRIPRNSVGFVDCRPNPPEDMCVDMDRNGGEV